MLIIHDDQNVLSALFLLYTDSESRPVNSRLQDEHISSASEPTITIMHHVVQNSDHEMFNKNIADNTHNSKADTTFITSDNVLIDECDEDIIVDSRGEGVL